MQIRNNYNFGLMNGTIGYVVKVDKQAIVFNFEGREVTITRDNDDINDIVLAYATTVHKAQGSEFPVVIAVAHRSQSFMLHRNLLYTAVTRARKTAILIGDTAGIDRALKRTDATARQTFMSLVDLREITSQWKGA